MTGVKVSVTVTSEPDSPKPREGTVVTLARGDEVVRAVASTAGVATFSDVGAGDHLVRVAQTPQFYLSAAEEKALTVVDADIDATVALTPLVLTIKSTLPQAGVLDFQQVEVWQVEGSTAAKVGLAVDLEAASTPVPIPAVGDYQLRTVRPLPGHLQPPEDAGPKVRLNAASPAAEVMVPERSAKLKVSVKEAEASASDAVVAGVKVKVEDQLGVVGDGKTTAEGVVLRRTGPHKVTVTAVPSGMTLASESVSELDVPWNGNGNAPAAEVNKLVPVPADQAGVATHDSHQTQRPQRRRDPAHRGPPIEAGRHPPHGPGPVLRSDRNVVRPRISASGMEFGIAQSLREPDLRHHLWRGPHIYARLPG